MTNAIEQTKREMYEHLDVLKYVYRNNPKPMLFGHLESAMEAHLEELRKALVAANQLTVQCAQHSAESFVELEKKVDYWRFLNGNQAETIIDLQSRLAAMTENRDELARGNLAGVKAYGAMKQERDDIQLRLHAVDHAYNEQQGKVGTSGQVCADRGSSEQTDAKTMAILGAVVDCQQLVSDWAAYGYRAKKQMKKMAYVLNNNPELRAALIHFEGSDKA